MKSIEEQTREAAELEYPNPYDASREMALQDAYIFGAEWERRREKWINVKDRPIEPLDGEVIAYHPDWIDEDFNPSGTRAGFMLDDGRFISSRWIDYHDCYMEDDTKLPTHYMLIPEPPKQKEDNHD